jgi:predicted ATPase
MEVREYTYAVDALEEIEERKLHFQAPITQIIHGTELTLEELHRLATKEGT